jgi:hypothetical protein
MLAEAPVYDMSLGTLYVAWPKALTCDEAWSGMTLMTVTDIGGVRRGGTADRTPACPPIQHYLRGPNEYRATPTTCYN